MTKEVGRIAYYKEDAAAEVTLRELEKEMINLPSPEQINEWIGKASLWFPFDKLSYQRVNDLQIPHRTAMDLEKIALRIFRDGKILPVNEEPLNIEFLRTLQLLGPRLDRLKSADLTINDLAQMQREYLIRVLFPQNGRS